MKTIGEKEEEVKDLVASIFARIDSDYEKAIEKFNKEAATKGWAEQFTWAESCLHAAAMKEIKNRYGSLVPNFSKQALKRVVAHLQEEMVTHAEWPCRSTSVLANYKHRMILSCEAELLRMLKDCKEIIEKKG